MARGTGVIAQIVVPIAVEKQVEGLLYVENRTARPFTDREESILQRLATHAGMAIGNARRREAL